MTIVAIDAMGGDNGVAPVVEGLKEALNNKEFKAFLVGDEGILKSFLDKNNLSNSKRVEIIHTTDVFPMNEKATNAHKRKDSSIFRVIEIVKDGIANTCVSAGHSGATMSLATTQIGRINGVLRPAICTYMPTIGSNPSLILDVGANTDCKPEYLVDFALMGYYYSNFVVGIEAPRVGILSNGEEDCKGNELTKEAFRILKESDILGKSFIGNVESSDIFNASTDVIVCDGFVGNLVLKASEAVAGTISKILKNEIKRSFYRIMGAFLLKDVFRALKNKVDYAEYGGAFLLGIKKPVIISHGKSNARAIECAIYQALKAHDSKVYDKISDVFANFKNLKDTK